MSSNDNEGLKQLKMSASRKKAKKIKYHTSMRINKSPNLVKERDDLSQQLSRMSSIKLENLKRNARPGSFKLNIEKRDFAAHLSFPILDKK
jgi:hypothetical protein